jgi:hypothetical protein
LDAVVEAGPLYPVDRDGEGLELVSRPICPIITNQIAVTATVALNAPGEPTAEAVVSAMRRNVFMGPPWVMLPARNGAS